MAVHGRSTRRDSEAHANVRKDPGTRSKRADEELGGVEERGNWRGRVEIEGS